MNQKRDHIGTVYTKEECKMRTCIERLKNVECRDNASRDAFGILALTGVVASFVGMGTGSTLAMSVGTIAACIAYAVHKASHN